MNIALKEFAISKIICRTEGNQYKRQVAFMMVGPQGGRYIGNKGGLVMLQCPEYSAIVPITWIAIELQQTSFPQIIRTFSTETFVGGVANCPPVFLSYFSLWICYGIQPAVVTPYMAVQNVWTISPARNHQFESSFWLKRLAIYM